MNDDIDARQQRESALDAPPRRMTDGELVRRHAHARAVDAETDSSLRKLLGYGATVLMAAQIAAADVVFVLYASNNGWEIPAATANVWLAAAVVQVVALAHTVARHLFPASRRGPSG